jgi:hypothetical protein
VLVSFSGIIDDISCGSNILLGITEGVEIIIIEAEQETIKYIVNISINSM